MTLQGLSHSQKKSSSNKKFDSIFRSNVGNYISKPKKVSGELFEDNRSSPKTEILGKALSTA